MITGQSPFGGEDEEELFDSICNSKIPYSRYLETSTINFLDKVNEWLITYCMCGHGYCRKRVWWLLLGQVVIFVVIIHVTDIIFKVLAIILRAHLPSIYYLQPVHFFFSFCRGIQSIVWVAWRKGSQSDLTHSSGHWTGTSSRGEKSLLPSNLMWYVLHGHEFGTMYYVRPLPSYIFLIYTAWPTHDHTSRHG